MALAHYRAKYWFPSGVIAAGVPARIFPLESNTLALIFTDVTGTTPLPNPLNTDGAGFLDFWAEEGEYWVNIDSRTYRIPVGTPSNLDVFEVASIAQSTGLIYGGNIAPSGTSITISETVGYVVDQATDPIRPTLTRVHIAAQAVPLDAGALARTLTWWLLDAAGGFVQQPGTPTRVQRRTHIVIGYSLLFGGVVVFTNQVPQDLNQPYNTFADFADAAGPFFLAPARMTPNGANLSFDVSSGELFFRSFARDTNPNDPNAAPTGAQSPTQFRTAYQTQTVFSPGTVTVLDVGNYDAGGTLTPVPGGPLVATVQRVFCLAQEGVPDQIAVQYGQRVYPSLSAAVSNIATEAFVVNPLLIGALLGWICVIKSATNLSDQAQAAFVPAPAKFSRP